MDFRNRSAQPHQAQPVAQPTVNAQPVAHTPVRHSSNHAPHNPLTKWLHIASVTLLFSITILLIAVVSLIYAGGHQQGKVVKDDKFQAVFLNNGQVYFGHIKSINETRVDLQDIYYLQTSNTEGQNSENANSNVSLVKLGCELHAPYDQMLINSDQVIFWENLQDSGQVSKAITEYVKQNPNGQKCSEQSQSSTNQAPSTNNTQNTNKP